MGEVETMNDSLSIVIPSHRRADLLHLCLRSVKQFAPLGTAIVVVDDGSADAIISKTASAYGGVKVIRFSRQCGFCSAANAGIAATRTEFVELLNDDAEVTAGWAEAALKCFADVRVAAVAPLVLQNDDSRSSQSPLIDSAGDTYDFGGFARKRAHGLPLHDAPEAGIVFAASACAAFYRRSALVEAGGFPEHFRAYFDDVDLSCRLRRLGMEIAYEPSSVVWHRVSSTYGKKPSRRTIEWQSCNEERLFWRNMNSANSLHAMMRHGGVLAAKALRRFQEGNLVPWVLGRIRSIVS